jgi:hypothetical protein
MLASVTLDTNGIQKNPTLLPIIQMDENHHQTIIFGFGPREVCLQEILALSTMTADYTMPVSETCA